MAPLIQEYDIITLDESDESSSQMEDASIAALYNSSTILNTSLHLGNSSFHNLDTSYRTVATAPLHESFSTIHHKQSANTSSRRNVSFAALEETHEVLHRSDYSEEEKTATWYSKEYLRELKSNAKSDAKLADQGLLVVGRDATLRGLEGRTREGMRLKSINRREAYASVFSEISFQREVEYHDEDMIADAYFLYSEPCAEEAHRIGQRDELEAQAIHDNRDEQHDLFGDASFCKKAFVESLIRGNKKPERRLSLEEAAAQHPLLVSA